MLYRPQKLFVFKLFNLIFELKLLVLDFWSKCCMCLIVVLCDLLLFGHESVRIIIHRIVRKARRTRKLTLHIVSTFICPPKRSVHPVGHFSRHSPACEIVWSFAWFLSDFLCFFDHHVLPFLSCKAARLFVIVFVFIIRAQRWLVDLLFPVCLAWGFLTFELFREFALHGLSLVFVPEL